MGQCVSRSGTSPSSPSGKRSGPHGHGEPATPAAPGEAQYAAAAAMAAAKRSHNGSTPVSPHAAAGADGPPTRVLLSEATLQEVRACVCGCLHGQGGWMGHQTRYPLVCHP